jgi:hypothetical protein
MKRRTLLQAALAALATWPVRGLDLRTQPRVISATHLAMLNELAAAVLPESLSRTETDAVVEQFLRWLTNYRAGAVLETGYGHTRQQELPPSPAERYAHELDQLERAARSRGQALGSLSLADRRDLIGMALAAAGVEQLPTRAGHQHVAGDLMAFYFRGSDALDRCYGAAIRRYDCRGLDDAAQPPRPLERAG